MPDLAPTIERQVPVSAFSIPATMQFAADNPETKKLPVTLFARSKEPVQHWYWGAVYHDFETMSHKPSIPLDYLHNDSELIGAGTSFTVKDDGLHVSGHLVKSRPRVQELMELSESGVPFEASIDFRGDYEIHELVAGHSTQVNGQLVQGPAIIFRNWILRAVAICPHGYDPNARSQFSNPSKGQDGDVTVQIFQIGEPSMPNPKAADPKTTEPETQLTQKPAETPAAPAIPPVTQLTAEDHRKEYNDRLKQFTAEFGTELGTQWFLDGKTLEQAHQLHNSELKKQLAAKDAEKEQLQKKLESLHVGEDAPASFNQDTKDLPAAQKTGTENRFASMGKIGAFASQMQIPTGKAKQA